MKQEKTTIPSQILTKAAEQLVKKIESPSAFLLFLTDAIHWLHKYYVTKEKYNSKDDHHFTPIVIIENVVTPWFKGGPDMISNIASGLWEVISYCGDEGLRELINHINCKKEESIAA